MEKSMEQYTPKRKTEVWGHLDDGSIEVTYNKLAHKLSPLASYVFEHCNGRYTVNEIVNKAVKNGKLSSKIIEKSEISNADVLESLASLKNDDLIILNYNSLHSATEYNSSAIYPIAAVNHPVDILFVSPPSPLPYAHREDMKLEPLGLGYMSSYLKSFGFSVGIIDSWVRQLNLETIYNFINRHSPKIVGITTKTVNFENGVIIADAVKKVSPDTIIIFGGYHVTFLDEEALAKNDSIDIIVRGEGEHTIVDLANYFLRNIGDLSKIDGITMRRNNKIIRTKERALICDLDTLPFPDRLSLDDTRVGVAVSVQTSRGCPSKCVFCAARGLSGGRYRQRSAENIISEIEFLLSKGVKSIFFQDDTITADIKRLQRFLCLIEDKGIKFRWNAESRVDALEKDLSIIKRMVNAGCVGLQFGIESGSQAILDSINKNITIKQIHKTLTATTKECIDVRCSFIIGHPQETLETMKETINLAKDIINLGALSMLAIACPFPGSDIYKQPEYYGLNIHHYDYSNYSPQLAIMDTAFLTAKQLKKYHYEYVIELNRHLRQYRFQNLFQRTLTN